MRVYGIQGFVNEEMVEKKAFVHIEQTLRKMHNFILRKLSTIPMPNSMKDVATKYDPSTCRYLLYHTMTVLDSQETRALAEFMKQVETAMWDEDLVHAAETLASKLGPYDFSPDVKEGEFGFPLV